MRAEPLRQALFARFRHPAFLGVALVLAALPCLVFLALPHGTLDKKSALAIETGFLLFIPGIAFAPIVWQWSGDDRPMARWWRGLLQFLAFVTVQGFLILGVLWLMGIFQHGNGAFLAGLATGLSAELALFLGPIGLVMARLERLGREAQDAKQRAREVQWMGNRGSFSPRLLFSNLQHLADLAHRDVRGTEQGLLDLAALYRQGLIEADHPVVSLSTERELAEQYLALERPRWNETLIVRWHIDPDLEHLPLPPLVLLPLFEAVLAPGPDAGDVHLDVNVDCATLNTQPHLRMIFTQTGTSPRPVPSVEEAILQRIQSICRGGQIQGRNENGGWELELWVPITGETA